MGMKFTNNATTTLASGITNVDTSLTVQTGGGTLFPTLGAGDYFYCTLANLTGTVEIIKVTARSGDSFTTIVRAQDGTTNVAWNSGDKVELRLVRASLNDFSKLDENNVFTGTNTENLSTSSTAVTQPVGDNSNKIATTAFTQTTFKQIIPIGTPSVAANALTMTTGVATLDFRNATLANGPTIPSVLINALSITVPSGATLGTVNATQARLFLLVAYNGGTPVLCVVNLAGGLQLDETNLISPTTISAGATSSSVIYSASAVGANSPYRVIGYVDITEATAGTWATAPTLVQPVGGTALGIFARLSDFMGSNQSLASNGYQKLPGGLILQWGSSATSSSADTAVTFPVAFPNAVLNVEISCLVATGNGYYVNYNTPTLTGFQVASYDNSTTRVALPAGGARWFAIGY